MTFRISMAVLAALALAGCSRSRPAALETGLGFKITLGAADPRPASWDGSVEVTGGKLLSLSGWRFTKDDNLQPDGKSWKCATRHATELDPQLWWWPQAKHEPPADPKATQPVGPLLPNGVFVMVDRASEIRVVTTQGNFSFSPGSVAVGKPASFLNGRALVERAVAPLKVTGEDGLEDDNPSIALDADNRPIVAWIGYAKERDQIFAAAPGEKPAPVGKPGVYHRTSLARRGRNSWLVTSALEGENWNLIGARFDGRRWSDPQPLTATSGPKLFHRLTVDSNNRLWLVWQDWPAGKSVIHATYYNGQRWSETLTISDNAANAWEPSVAADSQGRVYFAWDAYDGGNYNVYFRAYDGKQFQPQQQVTRSAYFQAHAGVAVDAQGRPWVAWEEAGPNWGKDTGFWVGRGLLKSKGEALYERRGIHVAVLDGGRWLQPGSRSLHDSIPAPLGEFTEQPQLVRDSTGRMWCFFRRRTPHIDEAWSVSLKRTRLQQYSQWEYFASYFDAASWSAPVAIPSSDGRNDFRLAPPVAASDGRIAAAWSSDGRTWAKPYPFVKNNVYTGWIEASGPARPATLPALQEEERPAPVVHPREAQQLAAIQNAKISAGGKTYRIVRGDMHRHTDMSFDGDLDGSYWDFYRYAIDAAGFEYSALTDHNSGEDNEYLWWIIQKSNDLFYAPGRFTPIYAYERSLAFPNGHRNILFPRRGVRTLERSKTEIEGTEGAANLYKYLRQNNGLAMPHTSHTLMGTDWRDNDPGLEPLVEIYQGDRTSAEYEGAPRGARGSDILTQPGGYRPEGFVWNAWAKGYKLGVQASSDHSSTHISYACLLVEGTSREGILDAIRRRHAYAATDNIILDFRISDTRTGDHLMGESFSTVDPPKIMCRAQGTAAISRIELIKNNKFIYSVSPNKNAAEFSYQDKAAARRSENYYYVRLQQADGQMAWSSPIWVKLE